MNKFFEFQKYTERQDQRPYYRGVWDKLKMEQFRLLPFQYKKTYDGVFSMYQDTTEITDHFFGGTNKITGWTYSGTATFTSSGSTISTAQGFVDEYFTSNAIALTSGDNIYFKINAIWGGSGSPGTVMIEVKYGATVKKTITGVTNDYELTYTSTDTGDHTIVITWTDLSGGVMTDATTFCYDSIIEIYNGTDDYVTYNGEPLYDLMTLGECYFNIKSINYSTSPSDYTIAEEFFSEDCDVCRVNTFLNNWDVGDWYLPSLSELQKMHDNLHVSGKGDFSVASLYWSSSEVSSSDVYTVFFSDGQQYSRGKANTYIIRPSRTFSSLSGDYSIGDIGPTNGWIYYIDGTTYYEAAEKDVTSSTWSNVASTEVTGTGTAIGTGLTNTLAIIDQTGHTASAAQDCVDYDEGILASKDLAYLANGDVAKSNTFYVQKSDSILMTFKSTGDPVTDLTAVLTNGTESTSLTVAANGDIYTITGTAQYDGNYYIQLTSAGSLVTSDFELTLGYSDNYLTFEVESTVDYGGIHYADGFKQKWYKEATIRRSPSPQITVIGDDPDGVVIKEKVITATKYYMRVKITEAEFNALLTATAGTVTTIDQTGHTFTCNSPELAEPSWSQGNGIAEFSFLDNVSIHTLNNSLL